MKKVADFRLQDELFEGFDLDDLDAPEGPANWIPEERKTNMRPSVEKKRFLEEVIYEKAVEEAMVQGGMVSLEIDDDELYGILIFEGKELMRVHQDTRMDELVQDLLRKSTYYYMNAKENEIHLEFHFRLAEETV